MPMHGEMEHEREGFPSRPQPHALRFIKIVFKRERRHTEQLVKGLLSAINTEIGLAEKRMTAKLEDIDTSINVIAAELARRDSDPPSNDTG